MIDGCVALPIPCRFKHGLQFILDFVHAVKQGSADFNVAIDLDPTDAAVVYCRGNSWYAIGESEKAIADYSEAIRLDPTWVNPYVNRAWTYEELGRLDEAAKDDETVLRLDSESDAEPEPAED